LSVFRSTKSRLPAEHSANKLSLVNSVRPHWRDGRLRPADEARRLRVDPGAFADFLDRLLGGRPAWLLILDQMEEIFAPEAAAYRDAFVDLLRQGLEEPRFRVIATLRADFQPQVVARPALCSLLKRGRTYPVGAPGPLALACMIQGTAEAVGLGVEPALTEQLVREADREAGVLALLAAALQDTWLAAAGGETLRRSHYTERRAQGTPTVEVAHETLLREWPRLAEWSAPNARP